MLSALSVSILLIITNGLRYIIVFIYSDGNDQSTVLTTGNINSNSGDPHSGMPDLTSETKHTYQKRVHMNALVLFAIVLILCIGKRHRSFFLLHIDQVILIPYSLPFYLYNIQLRFAHVLC